MVDITFLLLVFFMVTASFATYHAFEQNHEPSASTKAKPDEQERVQQVELWIDEQNRWTLIGQTETMVSGKRQLRGELRAAAREFPDIEVQIYAHQESAQGQVVMATDAATGAGISRIAVSTQADSPLTNRSTEQNNQTTRW